MGIFVDTGSSRRELADIAFAKRMAEVLNRFYPGHLWAVTVDSMQGIATVLNLRFSGKWGFMLKLRDLTYEDEIVRECMNAGGELLERYQMARGRFSEDEYQVLPTTRLGDHIADGQPARREVKQLPPPTTTDFANAA